jgi:hypothetical protein
MVYYKECVSRDEGTLKSDVWSALGDHVWSRVVWACGHWPGTHVCAHQPIVVCLRSAPQPPDHDGLDLVLS